MIYVRNTFIIIFVEDENLLFVEKTLQKSAIGFDKKKWLDAKDLKKKHIQTKEATREKTAVEKLIRNERKK